jgi:hypothetical protein
MDKEVIEKRISDLRSQLEQVKANGNGLIGAIAECEYWLAQITAGPKEPIPSA